MKTLNKNFKIMHFFAIVLGILLFVNFVGAIAISKEYHSENPVKIGPGETKDVSFGLILVSQEEGNRDIELNLTEGSEIATIIGDKSFNVLAGSRDKDIRLKVSIPEGVSDGTKYTITIRVFDKTPPSAGMVGFTTSTTSSIPVLVEKSVLEPVSEKSSADYSLYIIILVIVIVIAIAAYFLLRKKGNIKSK